MPEQPQQPAVAVDVTVTPEPPNTARMEETQVASASTRLPSQINAEACLVNIYPTGPNMGARFKIGEKSLFLGRDDACEIKVDDPSVSRRHAEVRPGLTGHYVVDLQSTNGTFVNDRPATVYKLKDGDYVRVGNWIFRYLTGGNIESQYHEEIYRLTIMDGLTGIHNKRALVECLERELARSTRYQRPLSVVMFDIDRFKSINDTLGHLGGDYALRELAACIKGAVGKDQMFARYGGEEFALVLPEVQQEDAARTAEQLRALVEAHSFRFDNRSFPVTISLGVVTTNGGAELSPHDLIRMADEKLYQAKNSGRNRVVA